METDLLEPWVDEDDDEEYDEFANEDYEREEAWMFEN